MRWHAYTCLLCKKSAEDTKEYFSQLDTAARMQPMPEGYSKLVSEIYCQDCGKTWKLLYHFLDVSATPVEVIIQGRLREVKMKHYLKTRQFWSLCLEQNEIFLDQKHTQYLN